MTQMFSLIYAKVSVTLSLAFSSSQSHKFIVKKTNEIKQSFILPILDKYF